jgi:tRNA modification GTPase
VAFDQLEGTLTGAVRALDAELFELVAKLEASLDFPDEGFHFITRTNAVRDLERLRDNLAKLASDGRRGRLIREGRTVVIAGRPNVGKSSLFNALVGANRAIVTPLAGTTRDLLTEQLDVHGVPITLVDTAGLRASTDLVEEEGVRRAERAQEMATLTLVVLDRSQPLGSDDEKLLKETRGVRLVVGNKSDLDTAWMVDDDRLSDEGRVLAVSAATGAGLDMLRTAMVAALSGESDEDWRDTPMLSNLRHLQQVDQALAAVERGLDGLRQGATEELTLAELGDAREALESLARSRTSDDLLAHIFSRFCIGK